MSYPGLDLEIVLLYHWLSFLPVLVPKYLQLFDIKDTSTYSPLDADGTCSSSYTKESCRCSDNKETCSRTDTKKFVVTG
jgi:hypothetical protein